MLLLAENTICPRLTREDFRKALRGVNRNSCDGLAVKSAEMGFVAGEKGLATVLDGGGEHGAVFFRQEEVETRGRQRRRACEAGDGEQEILEIRQGGGELKNIDAIAR